MKQRHSGMLARSSFCALASISTVHAARADAPTAREGATSDSLEEIVVTAERKEQLLQDVPASVGVVTSQDIEKYNILNFQDIQKLVPGLQLINFGNGFATVASMRGVTYNENQAVPPTVTFYLNDTPVDSNLLFQSMYDVGQIEVLRGPQGTLRGLISPSGSITVTSHRPDLEQFGGYVSGSLGDLQNTNLQGAVNVPIVNDKFAIRIAGTRSEDSVNGIESLVKPISPNEITNAGRISARFAPTDDINGVVTYQHLIHNQHSYAFELVGSGAPGGLVPGTNIPAPAAGYNGPVIGPNQRLTTVDPSPNQINQTIDDVEGLFDWSFHGQKLSYVGSWSRIRIYSVQSGDTTNSIPGYDWADVTAAVTRQWTQEMRLSSEEALFGRLDYAAGFFYSNANVDTTAGGGPNNFLPGAFGSPLLAQPLLGPPNNKYALGTSVSVPSNTYEYAGYASLTFHVDSKTEVTGGIRYSTEQRDYETLLSFSPASIALALPAGLCSAIDGSFGATYPGICDLPIVQKPAVEPAFNSYHPVIYNVETSHHFTDDLMVYFRTGTSFRPGNLQVAQVLGGATSVALQPYVFPSPERSTSYEGGLKWQFLDRRVLFDIDYYHQTYKGLFYSTQPFYFLNTSTIPNVAPAVASAFAGVTLNAPAIVDGIELNASALITPHWNVTGVFSWSNGHLADAAIPCNPPVAGVPTVAYFQSINKLIYTCNSSTSTSTAPRWNFNVQSQYDQPINQALTAFIRALVYYYPSNPVASPPYVVPAYATLDLYLGLHDQRGQWEASLYGKNIANDQTVLNQGSVQLAGLTQAYFGNSGYYITAHNTRREFGLTLRYALGSR
jgi:iron complex outermembrane receptor protein